MVNGIFTKFQRTFPQSTYELQGGKEKLHSGEVEQTPPSANHQNKLHQ